jgi:hypothetical protein
MAQLFPPGANTAARASILGGILLVGLLLGIADRVSRSPWTTRMSEPREQPVPFSHKHHVGGVGLDCRYCHTSVETSSYAGIPPLQTCMTCHSQLWSEAPMLEPLRKAYREEATLAWVRVNDLPDFVYFNHSIHVHQGVGCTTCHGPVDKMPLMWQEKPLQMGWCLECHKAPQKFLRPRDQVFNVAYAAPADQLDLGRALVKDYNVHTEQLTNCSTCHR